MGFLKSIFGRDWQRFKKSGDALFEAGEWGRARGEYMSAIKAFSSSSGEDDLAQLDIKDKLEVVNYRLYESHLEAGKTHQQAEAIDKALEYYRLALEFAATSEAREELLQRITGLERGAVDAFEQDDHAEREELAPQQSDLAIWGGAPDVEEEYAALLAGMDEAQADVYAGLGDKFRDGYVALMEGRIEEAALLVELLDEDPSNVYLRYEVGRLRLAERNYEAAEELLAAACAQAPDVVIFRHARVEAVWGLEDYETAERVVEEAFEIDDELLENYQYAAETCLRSGEYDNGCEILEAGLETHETSMSLHKLHGQLEGARGNIGAAIDAFETVLRLRWVYDYETKTLSFDHEAAFLAANLYVESQTNVSRAEELYRALLATGDKLNRWAYLVGLAKIATDRGDPDAARKYYVDAVSVVDDDSNERQAIEKLLHAL